MAVPTCVKCEGHVFECGRVVPLGEQKPIAVLQCAGCGGVVGTIEQTTALKALQAEVRAIDASLVRIVKALQD